MFVLQTEQIICEYKNRALILHPDKRHNLEDTEESFKKLVKAKEVLTDPQLRKSYDKWKNSGIAISFDKWNNLGKEVHNSMHWINKSNRDMMLESGQQDNSSSNRQPFPKTSDSVKRFWTNDYDNEMLRKFRNYQI